MGPLTPLRNGVNACQCVRGLYHFLLCACLLHVLAQTSQPRRFSDATSAAFLLALSVVGKRNLNCLHTGPNCCCFHLPFFSSFNYSRTGSDFSRSSILDVEHSRAMCRALPYAPGTKGRGTCKQCTPITLTVILLLSFQGV